VRNETPALGTCTHPTCLPPTPPGWFIKAKSYGLPQLFWVLLAIGVHSGGDNDSQPALPSKTIKVHHSWDMNRLNPEAGDSGHSSTRPSGEPSRLSA
jgi:hypothetical protein